MSQIFEEDGRVVPVTILEAGPCKIIQIKTKEKEGYNALQIGFDQKKRISKPLKGHFKGLGNFRYLREFKVEEEDLKKYKIGDEINISIFEKGNKVRIVGTSKGKGFAGVIKRHGFRGSPASHGTKHTLRAPGSIGATDPGRVFKGKKMAGRMGRKSVTVKGLRVVEIDPKRNLLTLSGAVPGARGGLVEIVGL